MEILRRGDVEHPERLQSEPHVLSVDCILSGHPVAPAQGKGVRLIELGFALSRDNERADQLTVPGRHQMEKKARTKACAQA